MQLTISAIVTMKRVDGQARYFVQTTGNRRCVASDVLLKSAINRLASQARKHLQSWVEQGSSQLIAEWLYDPSAEVKLFKEHLTLRDRTINLKTLLCTQQTANGTFVLAPLLDNLRFQRASKIPFTIQATEVLARWCDQKLRDDSNADLDSLILTGDAWIEPLDIVVAKGATKKKKKKKGMLGALLGQVNPGGAEALQRVGRCLDSYHNEHSALFGRETEAERLFQLLEAKRKQNVLLVGPASVGKTAILEEVVRRRVAVRNPKRRHLQQVWLISPGRVISGMSYLGQWEERWLSILKEAYRRDHVLYFDDPISLYTSGITRDSELCMADVLKAFIAEHPVRLVFEMPHAALSILRRRDRSLVDPMVPLTVDPTNEPTSLRTLIHVVSRIEARTRYFFHPGLLPKIIEYSSTLSPHLSLPGKAIAIAHGLAQKSSVMMAEYITADMADIKSTDALLDDDDSLNQPASSISGEDLDGFIEKRTGLRLDMRQKSISLKDFSKLMSTMIVGQSKAVDVLSRYAIRSLKGLQSNDRPLGVFLFMGPTGVGKTESAKALSHLLFHDDSRIVRIDMNEITSSQAAEQLIGTIEQPDGRLPSALRRQPNCVLLLDEIEKAHPDVLDYLLQVMGEGRLSDARGRLVDFRNAFIIMTSNLGSIESGQSLGYDLQDNQTASTHREAVYRKAAQQFFRPEFVNRLDEIVVFNRLERTDMRGIVDRHLDSLKHRDGISRRQIFLQVDDEATEWIIDRGYDSTLGARAIKRAIERDVAQPLADQMASTRLENPIWTRLRVVNKSIRCETEDLRIIPIGSMPAELSIDESLKQARIHLDQLREQLHAHSPSNDPSERRLSQFDYYAIHHSITEAEEFFKATKDWQKDSMEPDITPMHSAIKSSPNIVANSHRLDVSKTVRRDRAADFALREAISESSSGRLELGQKASRSRQLARLLTMAQLVMDHIDAPKRWILQARYLNPPKSKDVRGMIEGRNRFLRSLDMFPAQMVAWCGQMVASFGYTVAYPMDRSFAVIEGASVGGLITPILGTYQVAGDAGMERLMLFQARPVKDDFPIDSINFELDEFIEAGNLTRCQQDLDSMQNHENGEPLAEYCGLNDWKTVRGQIDENWQDYRTGASVPLLYSIEWNGWLLDQVKGRSLKFEV